MRALSSRAFGAVTVDPLATKPIPMNYDELNHEIRWCEQWLDSPAALSQPGRRVAVRLRLAQLLDARTAWDKSVAEGAAAETDVASDAAHANAERWGAA